MFEKREGLEQQVLNDYKDANIIDKYLMFKTLVEMTQSTSLEQLRAVINRKELQ